MKSFSVKKVRSHLLQNRAVLLASVVATSAVALIPVNVYGQADAKLRVDTIADSSDIAPGDGICADAGGACSLRAAIQEANEADGLVRIRLERNLTYTLTREGVDEDAADTGDLDISGSVLIIGRRATVDAANLDRAFDVLPGGSLEVKALTVTNGSVADANGGGFRNAGTLTLSRSAVTFSEATGTEASGGAIFNNIGTLRVDRSELSANTAERAGGAIEALGGATTIHRSEIVGNSASGAPGNGGGFHITGAGEVSITNSEFTANTASSEGGAAWNSSEATMRVRGTTFTSNNATGDEADNGGGALFNDGGIMRVNRGRFMTNSASNGSGSGGAVFNNQGTLRLNRSKFIENASNRAGGAVETVEGIVFTRGGLMKGNDAGSEPGNGGGLHVTGKATTRILQTTINGNTATGEGGGLWNSETGTMNIVRARVVNNRAAGDAEDQGGGGLFNDGGDVNIASTKINRNVASGLSGSGGGILNNTGRLSVSDSNINNNESSRAGGGIEANEGVVTLRDVKLLRNSTGDNPGNGGALHLTGAAQAALTSIRVINNSAAAEGGGIWNSATGTIVATRSTVRNNEAPEGANLFDNGGTFTLNGEEVSD